MSVDAQWIVQVPPTATATYISDAKARFYTLASLRFATMGSEAHARMFKLAQTFYQSVMPGVIKPLHVLWNEVIGFLFVALAVLTAPSAWRSYRAIETDPKNIFRLILTLLFSVTMAWFGVSSFLKARRIRRRSLN